MIFPLKVNLFTQVNDSISQNGHSTLSADPTFLFLSRGRRNSTAKTSCSGDEKTKLLEGRSPVCKRCFLVFISGFVLEKKLCEIMTSKSQIKSRPTRQQELKRYLNTHTLWFLSWRRTIRVWRTASTRTHCRRSGSTSEKTVMAKYTGWNRSFYFNKLNLKISDSGGWALFGATFCGGLREGSLLPFAFGVRQSIEVASCALDLKQFCFSSVVKDMRNNTDFFINPFFFSM